MLIFAQFWAWGFLSNRVAYRKTVYLASSVIKRLCFEITLLWVILEKKCIFRSRWFFFQSFSYRFRSSHRCSVKKSVLRNFAKFTRKHLYQRLLFNKVFINFFIKSLWHSCFPVNFVKFLWATFLKNTSGRLLL